MSIPLQLSIPQPCSEDWGSMTSHQRFKHCQLCNKSVYPLNEYDAEEALELIQQSSGACVKIEYNRDRQINLRTGFSNLLVLGGLLACGTTGPSVMLQGEVERIVDVSESALHIQSGEVVQVVIPRNDEDKEPVLTDTVEDYEAVEPVMMGKMHIVPTDITHEDVDQTSVGSTTKKDQKNTQ